jgi:hypothetical protein
MGLFFAAVRYERSLHTAADESTMRQSQKGQEEKIPNNQSLTRQIPKDTTRMRRRERVADTFSPPH